MVCIGGAAVGAALGLLISRNTPHWRDQTVGPWVGGLILAVPAVALLSGALAVRLS